MLYAIVTVIILILDQGLKYWTTLRIAEGTGLREVIPGLLELRNYHNSGSAWGLMDKWPPARWLFLVVTVVFAVVVIWALAKKVITGPLGRWTAVCVLAGALGNGIDRALHGYVVDMIQFGFWQSFPTFNIADIFITVGGIAFCLYIIFNKEPLKLTQSAPKRGPGGSVVTSPAPKRTPRPAPEAKEAAPRRQAAAPAPKRAAAPVPRRQARKVDPDLERGAELERIQKPVATKETFAELTRRKPGDDPFAEWTQPRPAPKPAAPEATETEEPTQRIREVQPEPVRPAAPIPEPEAARPDPEPERPAAPIPQPEPVSPEPEAVKPAPEPEPQDVDEDMEFSLEDILNEFRD